MGMAAWMWPALGERRRIWFGMRISDDVYMSIGMTVTLDEDVYVLLQQESRSRGLSFQQTLNAVIRVGLRAETPKRSMTIETFEMGAFPGLDYDNIGDLLEHIEGPNYR